MSEIRCDGGEGHHARMARQEKDQLDHLAANYAAILAAAKADWAAVDGLKRRHAAALEAAAKIGAELEAAIQRSGHSRDELARSLAECRRRDLFPPGSPELDPSPAARAARCGVS
jgi:predicted ArsR family transcriptional regulator